ncbi:MAG: hypothetical protein UW20_C0020G0007 [Candidatus Woesebacteria bacterium GW2011_GWB1_44_11]|uniref:Uncharacterized protein n=1 Tax=Candidatus Woesebacteria bacterium GW2011_GWB1_44_11 TaxID=1618579 RepID=A0A837I6P6_9BACT|nr:MAG: hypothetical protein UW20_C0020G0007 [Candidatus Woesebacteria bacterium GW2011_GWB1_44_11]
MKRILITAAIVLPIAALVFSQFFIKVRIDCKSQYGDCPEQISGKLNVFNGKSLFSAKRGVKKALSSELLISDYSLQYKIPNILRVQDSALPVITLEEELPDTGQSISQVNLFALDLAVGTYQMYQIRESEVRDGSLLVELPGQIRVIFPLEGDSEILLGSLRLIYSKLREDGNLAGYSQIDLRYRNPVLR